MIVTTLSTYPGKRVVKDLGIISAYDLEVRGFRMVMNLDKYIQAAQEQLFNKAKDLGGNAVLGVCFDLRDTVKPVLMGTAVVLEDE